MRIYERCSQAFNSIPQGIVKASKFGFSLVVIGAGTLLAKNIYDLSLLVLKETSHVPYDQFFALGMGVISTAYLSWRLTSSAMSDKKAKIDLRAHEVLDKEISAFHPGEGKAEIEKRDETIKAFS